MGYGKCSLLCVVLALALCSTINALDITAILSKYPEYAQFSKSLTETKLAEQINSLSAVTVLALDNDAMAALAGKPQDVVKSILSNHILTKYYDSKLLSYAQGSQSPMETVSKGNIYVSLINEGEYAFGTFLAGPGAPLLDVTMVRPVETQPETVSVFQVSKAINNVTPGTGASKAVAFDAAKATVAGAIAAAPSHASALAPAPAPTSASSRLVFGFFAVVSAFASLLLLA